LAGNGGPTQFDLRDAGLHPGDAAADSPSPDASSCHPGNVLTFVAPEYRHASTSLGACTSSQIAGYEGCVDPQTAWSDAGEECQGDAGSQGPCPPCIVTPATASGYGPFVSSDGLVERNTAGCIEIEAPAMISCAKAVQALTDCEHYACEANCPVTDAVSLAAYQACATSADQSGCYAYSQAAQCVAEGDGGIEICETPSFEAFYDAIVPLFCGPPATAGDASNGTADASAAEGTDAAAGLAEAAPVDGAGGSSAEGDARVDASEPLDGSPSDAPRPDALIP
jgi:hypothetical protein